jgi:phosphate transport system substrate-binding protein
VARQDSSGTTYIFTNFLNTAAPTVWTTAPSKAEIALPSNGLNEPGNAGVASAVVANTYALGYIEYSYLLLNPGLKAANVLNKAGKYVAPSVKSIAADAAQVPTVSSTSYAIVFEGGATSYPITGYSWAIIMKDQTGVASSLVQAQLLCKFLDWLSHTTPVKGQNFGQDVAALQGYVSLPKNIQGLARTTLLSVTYNGSQAL